MIQIDFHTHTCYSADCRMKIPKLLKEYTKKKITPLITDHNTLSGARAYSKLGPCFTGIEVSTKEGEVIAAFITRSVPQGLPLEKTIDLIHAQKGIVIVPHPFDRLRKHRVRLHTLNKRVLDKIDVIEVFNSRTVFALDNRKAQQFAVTHDKPMVVGSDSHTVLEIGKSYVQMQDFSSPKDFLVKLRKAKLVCNRSSIFVHVFTKILKIVRGVA